MPSVEVATEVSGTVWKLRVGVGDTVAADQELVIVESMKMEIPATAPAGGTVRQVLVAEGEAVAEGQVLVVLQSG
jgi:acetyl-CoA carboxylase biotin carboxyl carrier protein